MSRKSYTSEQIIGMLREAEVALIAWQANVRFGSKADVLRLPTGCPLLGVKRTLNTERQAVR